MADPTPQDPTPDPGQTDPPANPPADPPQDPETDPDKGKGGKDALLADLAKERDKRQELETRFSEAENQRREQMDALAKALGLKPDDAPADPAKLAEQITAEQAKTATVEAERDAALRRLAVYDLAASHEAHAPALLDSARFLESIKDIDHTDATKLGEAIAAAVEADARFKASTTNPTPPFPGGPRTPAPSRAGSLQEAIEARLASSQR